MSVQDYMSALKLGKKEYHACVNKGAYPYLPVLENLVSDDEIDSEVSLSVDQIPLRLVVGTCNASRTNAFAGNFMPLLDWGTEFSAKWASLSDSQVNEGIRDPIKVYEYMNKFYVLEGNKRVSVLKYFNAVTVNAEVIRKIPKKSDNPEVKIYYEFMEFYKCTRLNDIYFSEVGSFPSLMKLVGIEPDKKMDEDAKKDFVSCFLSFKNAFDSRGGDRFDYPVGDAFLRFIHIFGYDTVKKMTPSDMAKNVAKSWAEFVLLSEDSAVDLKMDPTVNEPKKNILSYLLPRPDSGSKKLKVGFIYENTPQDSEWCYAHELGRQYIDDTFGKQIETISITNVKPEKDDEMGRLMQAFEKMRIRLRDNAEEKLKSDRESKELISNISHDLKTPITAIKGYVEGIRDGVADTPEKMEKYIGTIYNKANEMDTLINELTLYAKIDTNRIPYNFAPLSVNDYFNDCAEDIEMELDSKNVEFGYFNYVEGDQKIIADPEQLKRVINNIVSNSLKYMEREHGLINLRVKDVGDFIQVELEDNGKGIAAKDLPNIFDRFYRTDASRNSSKGGSGIGLSIVKKIIEDHGGKIWATSREGVGTVMYFVIRKYQEVPINE